MKRSIIFILTLIFASSIIAQDEKEIKNLFKEAESNILWGDYNLALPIYLEILDKGWDNANIQFNIGNCYMNVNRQIGKAIPYLENASVNITSNYKEGNYKEEKAPEEALFFLAKAYRIDSQFDKAIETYQKFQSMVSVSDVYMHEFLPMQIKSCETAKKMQENPVHFLSEELDFGKQGDNYYPSVSGNEQSIAFTAYQEENDPDFGSIFFEYVYFSTKEGDQWKKPKDLTSDLVSDGYFSTAYLSYNGDFLILFRDYYGNGNLYYSELEGRRWSPVSKFPKQISGRDNEVHGSITKDGSTLYFVSNRQGGSGEKDIWYSIKDSKGKWGTPINMGETINTPFIEEAVFIGEDENTIYFASEGHNSMGGFDIFKSTKDSGGNWSEPQNLGYPINTPADDVYYMPIGDGSVAYYAKFPETGGEQRIYRIEFPETERIIEVVAEEVSEPADTLIVNNETDTQSTESNTETEVPVVETKTITVPSDYELKGSLTLQDNKELDPSFYIHVAKPEGEVVAALSPDITTGEFRTKIKYGSYVVKAFGDGYEPVEKFIYISETEQNAEVLTFLEMTPKEVSSGEYFTIKSVLFDYNSSELNRDAQIEVEKLAILMQKNSSLYLEVVGNSDSHGSDEYNQKLSIKRSRSVIDYLNDKGIVPSRFVAKGMGKDNFIALNENPDGSDNPEGRHLNRRVDMKVIRSNNDKITVENIYVPDELKYKEQLSYTIFLMETEKPLKPSYFSASGENIANVWMFRVESGYLYTVGKFNHQADALTLMNVVVDAGFPNARVISSI
jgi:outer membrane protein OmpA-like peptidoglycan-associated protein/tetratricopeptide (TPR) repeat protein